MADFEDIGETPEETNQRQRFQTNWKCAHLTYRGHLPHQELLTFLIQMMGPMKWYSMVHEVGDTAAPYPHTHVCFLLETSTKFTSPRKLDFAGVHPHIKVIKTIAQQQNTWTYHEKAPIGQITRSEATPIRSKEWISEIQKAPSLAAAVQLMGIDPTKLSVRDIQALRHDTSVRTVVPKKYQSSSFTIQWNPNWHTVYIHGLTGCGKTQWAISMFDTPLLVRHMDDLKGFESGHHDGIIFDDICLGSLPATTVIHLTDWDLPSTINVKYGAVTIPAETPKIITSNISLEEQLKGMPLGNIAAIMRRLTVIPVYSSLYEKLEPTPLALTFNPSAQSDAEMSQFSNHGL